MMEEVKRRRNGGRRWDAMRWDGGAVNVIMMVDDVIIYVYVCE